MSIFAGYSREQLRQTYAEAWRKHLEGVPMTPLEVLIADVIGAHPEYADTVKSAAAAVQYETGGNENPFLHMGLHIAIREQISIDRPPGIRDLHRQLQVRFGGVHDAEHVLLEALGETLWEAQRAGKAPDESVYMAKARQRLSS